MVSEHEIDPFIEDIAAELKRPVRFDSTFESRVVAALDPASSTERKSTPWILRPRTFYVSPLAGLAVAAGIVAIVTMSVLRTQPNKNLAVRTPDTTLPVAAGPIRSVSNTGVAPVMVSAPFTYIDSTARTVTIVGTFNDWDSTKTVLTRTSDGVWRGDLMLLPGRYEYQLVVDGKWIADPRAKQTAASEFGTANSVLIVSPVPR